MQANYNLEHKKILITGGASGIGLGTAEAFLKCGAHVAINDLAGSKLEQIVKKLQNQGYPVTSAPGDVGDAQSAQSLVDSAIAQLGGLDYLVNNAATPGTTKPIAADDFEQQTEEFWQKLLSVNLIGPYRCMKAAADTLRDANGAVVNTASIAAFGGGGSSAVYSATKAGLVVLTKEWARALAPAVRVNAIAPGIVDSDWQCRFDEAIEVEKVCPLGRKGSPEDYAECILFLCASASYITGQTLIVDGGLGI